MTQIRLHGTNKELVDEIVSLGLRYGIVTPYTSFLVDERQNVLSPPAASRRPAKPGPRRPCPLRPPPGRPPSRPARRYAQLREAPSAAAATQSAQMRTIDDKTFLLRDGVWTDTQYREDMKTVDVGFGSADYFALLAARPEWGKYFAVGEKVIVLLDGVAYRVAEGTFPHCHPGHAGAHATGSHPVQPNPLSLVEPITPLMPEPAGALHEDTERAK